MFEEPTPTITYMRVFNVLKLIELNNIKTGNDPSPLLIKMCASHLLEPESF